jgi:small-conductance mechanosensitive channel/CRP-like cAMP-binding protein
MSYQGLIEIGMLEVLFVISVFALSVFLYAGLRYLNRKILMSRNRLLGLIFSKILSPFAFLIVVLFVRVTDLVKRLQLNVDLTKYIDAAALFFLILFLIRLVDSLFERGYEQRKKTFPLPRLLHRFLLLVLYLLVLFIVLKGVAGVDITPLLATSAILTMILGLALQELLGNIVSGMSLHLIKSFSKGDWIKSGDKEGLVIDTNWRETRIRDLYSNIVVIPNNSIASEILINYSHPDQRTALTIPVKVSFASPPQSVMGALTEAASDLPEVSSHPQPEAYIIGYEDFGVSYVLKFWITDYSQKYILLGKVGRLIWYKFRRQGIEIPVPLSDKVQNVFKFLAQPTEKHVSEQEEPSAFQCLHDSSFFRYPKGEEQGELIVSEEEIRKLASEIKKKAYSAGEIVFKQGDKGESCFIVASGRIKGMVSYEEKGKKFSSEFYINPGEIFGEMSLYTGMPRTATGYIEQETELLEIGAEDFALLLSRNPDLAEIIAEIVSARNCENKAFLKKIKELSKKDLMDSCNKKSLLKRMKTFFASLGPKR